MHLQMIQWSPGALDLVIHILYEAVMLKYIRAHINYLK